MHIVRIRCHTHKLPQYATPPFLLPRREYFLASTGVRPYFVSSAAIFTSRRQSIVRPAFLCGGVYFSANRVKPVTTLYQHGYGTALCVFHLGFDVYHISFGRASVFKYHISDLFSPKMPPARGYACKIFVWFSIRRRRELRAPPKAFLPHLCFFYALILANACMHISVRWGTLDSKKRKLRAYVKKRGRLKASPPFFDSGRFTTLGLGWLWNPLNCPL